MALLSKPRAKYRVRNSQGRTIEKDTVTSLMIVPYRDLAYQILNWIESIVKQQEIMRERSMLFEMETWSEGFFTGINRVNCAAPFCESSKCLT